MKRRRLALMTAVALAVCLPTNCFAADYYLEDGSISIHADTVGQTVTQLEKVVEDLNPVIKNRDPGIATNNTIEISSDQDAVANVTIEDVNIFISEEETGSGIDVKGDSEVLLTVEGENSIESENGEAAVHVADGTLGITGDGTLNATTKGKGDLNVTSDFVEGAAIGTNEEEDLNGSIVIGGNSKVNANVTDDSSHINHGAAIGTGCDGNITKDASISVIDHAVVNAMTCDDGAGIGTGINGNIDGNIIIKDEADVTGFSLYDGSGVGTGRGGDLGEDALIWITGKAKVIGVTDDDGAGIGVGRRGEFHGKILIDGESNVDTFADSEGVGIGAGEDSKTFETAKIIIGGKAKVAGTGDSDCAGIGAGEDGEFAGSIIIQDEADVTALSGRNAASLGTDDASDMTGSIQILGNSKLTTGYMTSENDVVYDPTKPGMIGGGSYREKGNGLDPDFKGLVIGQGVTINGIMANTAENITNILDTYTDGITSDSDKFSQEEKPLDLKAFEPRLEQAKLPVVQKKPAEEPVKPAESAESAESVVPVEKASVTPVIKSGVTSNTVQTGDQANLTLWVSMIALACVGILGAKKVSKR